MLTVNVIANAAGFLIDDFILLGRNEKNEKKTKVLTHWDSRSVICNFCVHTVLLHGDAVLILAKGTRILYQCR